MLARSDPAKIKGIECLNDVSQVNRHLLSLCTPRAIFVVFLCLYISHEFNNPLSCFSWEIQKMLAGWMLKEIDHWQCRRCKRNADTLSWFMVGISIKVNSVGVLAGVS